MNTFDRNKNGDPGVQTKASHDTDAPPNLIAFLLRDWKPRRLDAKPLGKKADQFAARRKALSQRFPGECLVIPAGEPKVRANDTFYPFRPCSDFFYLTGVLDPGYALAMVPRGAEGHDSVLFVEASPGKTDPSFFTDRVKGELWVGPRPSLDEAKRLYAIADCRPLPELDRFAQAFLSTAKPWRLLRGHSPEVEKRFPELGPDLAARDSALATHLSEMRLLKDALEVRELSSAIGATHRGFDDVIARLRTARTEREVEGVFYTRARMEGNDVGYGTIAAAGHHACTLHWNRNDGALRRGDLLLLDAGVEGRSLYTADITRTLPLSGRFSREQREVYELVWEAQAAGIRAVRPGNDFLEPNRAAMRVLAEGLARLGILKVPAEEALAETNQFHRRYTLHNVSHMLGLDVHDCAQARRETYKFGKFQAGMVLTVEPGLYFQPDDLTVPARYRGIGVRIEDNVVVTAKGCRNLSGAIPSRADEVEAWMRRIWKKGARR